MGLGREKVRLQWQVAPLGTAFTATGIISGTTSWTDTLPSGITFTQEVSSLAPDTPYHWRVRLLYRQNRLGQTASRWIHIPWNGWQETDFRTPPVRVITYTYGPLYRLTKADYSTGELFEYNYDAAGNVLTYTRVITSQIITTTYTHNAANQLVTAKASDDPITWYYTYNNNGSLTDVTPNGLTPGNGARRYSYNQAGYLMQVETHNGAAYQPQAEMVYNGLGQRVELTAWTMGASLTTRYVLDGAGQGVPLAATANGQTTFYLYSPALQGNNLTPLAELTDEWAFYLPDGERTVRQLVDADGAVVLSRSYTPWGELLAQSGAGSLTWGYFGGWVDAATGLVYVGNGQYYDPRTGRFLSPVGRGRNPYVPASGSDPLGALLAPVAVIALLARRRRGTNKWNGWLLVLVLIAGAGIGLSACQPPQPSPPTPTPTLPPTVPPTPTPTPVPPTLPAPVPTPTLPPPASPTPLPTPTSTCTPIPPTPTGRHMTAKPTLQWQEGVSCGPTALFMLLRHKGAKDEQGSDLQYDQVLQEVGKEKYGKGRYQPGTNPVVASLGVIEKVAAHYASFNDLAVMAGDGWTLEGVTAQIDQQNPVMVNYGGCNARGERSGLGHSVVIYGIDWDTKEIFTVDPYRPHYVEGSVPGEVNFTFTAFETGWKKSDCGDPLQEKGHENWALVVF